MRRRASRRAVWVLFSAASLIFLAGRPAQAALIDNGDGTVTDTDLGIMWLQTAGPDANWADALTWAANLVFAGFDDWRLASAADFTTGDPDDVLNSVNNEFGHLYATELGSPANAAGTAPLVGYVPLWFWTSTANPDNGAEAYAFFWSFDGIWENAPLATSEVLHVTAVRNLTAAPPDDEEGGGDGGNGETNPVPEPSTLLLVGSAALATVLRRRRTD